LPIDIAIAILPAPLQLPIVTMDVNKLIFTVLEGATVVTALHNEQQQNKKKTDHRHLLSAKEHSKDVLT
jgi:hypothetical protein